MKKNLIERGKVILAKTDKFQQQLEMYQGSFNKLRKDFSELKSLVELNPEVNDILRMLQLKQHKKSVGRYEELLTSLLMEVLPGYREIVLDLTTTRQMPALDVLIKKDPNNPPEDVLHGTGGSVTNIIVAGFRIISVIRSGNRKFLLLDEPDCWLKEDYFPAFSRMLKEVSETLGVQILMISHDKNTYFSGDIKHQVEIFRNSEGEIQSRFNELPDWDVDEDIIKSIRLENFQSHKDTFIPLSPTVTILRGDNDLGKSSIASAFRAVFYGEGMASDIKHFTNQTTVTVEFNKEEKFLIWERKAKGRPIESYSMYNRFHGYDNPLHKTEGLTRGSVPDWLMDETGLGLFDKLDVQLTWQKEPLAFLSEGPHVRAKALSVGTEEDYIQKMMFKAKSLNAENKALLKSKESLIEDQRRMIVPLKKHSTIEYAEIKSKVKFLEDSEEKITDLESMLSLWETLDKRNAVLSKYANIDSKISLIDRTTEIKNVSNLLTVFENEVNKNNILSESNSLNEISELEKPKSEVLIEILNLYQKEKRKNSILKNIELEKELLMPDNQSEKINSLEELLSGWTNKNKSKLILEKIKSLSYIEEPKRNKEASNEMIKLGITWDKVLKNSEILSKVSNFKPLNIYQSNENKIKEATELGVNIKKIENNNEMYLNSLNQEKEQAEQLGKIITENFPVCPTCHREWDHTH